MPFADIAAGPLAGRLTRTLHRELRQLCCLLCRSDYYRLERPICHVSGRVYLPLKIGAFARRIGIAIKMDAGDVVKLIGQSGTFPISAEIGAAASDRSATSGQRKLSMPAIGQRLFTSTQLLINAK